MSETAHTYVGGASLPVFPDDNTPAAVERAKRKALATAFASAMGQIDTSLTGRKTYELTVSWKVVTIGAARSLKYESFEGEVHHWEYWCTVTIKEVVRE